MKDHSTRCTSDDLAKFKTPSDISDNRLNEINTLKPRLKELELQDTAQQSHPHILQSVATAVETQTVTNGLWVKYHQNVVNATYQVPRDRRYQGAASSTRSRSVPSSSSRGPNTDEAARLQNAKAASASAIPKKVY